MQHNKIIKLNKIKPAFRANDSAILSLALRPGLFKLSLSQFRPSQSFFTSKFLSSGIGLITLFSLTILGSFIVNVFNNSSVSASSVTLTIPSSALSLDIAPNSGTVFQKSSAGTINVATDSSYGYSLSIYSKNGDSDSAKSNDLLNGSNKIASIVSALNESDFQNSGSSNTWGYMPSKLNSSVNSDFQPGPTSEPTTLDVTDTSSSGTDYGITLVTKIDNTLPAGTYHNTFILTTTTNDPPYDDIMQNWAGCDDLLQETQTLNLLDTRDNKTYTVAKLKDGQCWMTQNLALGKEGSTTELTSADSDVSSNYSLPASSTSGFSDNAAANVYIDGTYGGYYTWIAATAGTGSSATNDGAQASGSICPKGWRLPTKDEYTALANTYGGNTSAANLALRSAPVNFVYTGYYYYGAPIAQGSRGDYWSSTAVNSSSARSFYLESSSVNVNSFNRYVGLPIRCVARYDKKVDTLQNVANWADSVEEGKTALSKDSRDNKEYTVARLADGKLWMTQNLEISNFNLTSSDSDVSSDFQIPASTDNPNSSNSYTSKELHVDSTYGGYYTWNASTVTSVKMSSTSPVICGVITTCPNEIDNPSAKLAGERAKIVREKLTTNETIAGTLSLITAPNSAEVIHYWTLKAEFA